MVVLAGYKTVKEALVNHAEEFGERDPILILHEFSQGHGKKIQTEVLVNNFPIVGDV